MERHKKDETPSTVEDVIAKANEAETLLETPVFKESCIALENDYINRWLNSDNLDEATREDCYRSIRNLFQIRQELGHLINNGKLINT